MGLNHYSLSLWIKSYVLQALVVWVMGGKKKAWTVCSTCGNKHLETTCVTKYNRHFTESHKGCCCGRIYPRKLSAKVYMELKHISMVDCRLFFFGPTNVSVYDWVSGQVPGLVQTTVSTLTAALLKLFPTNSYYVSEGCVFTSEPLSLTPSVSIYEFQHNSWIFQLLADKGKFQRLGNLLLTAK